VTSDGVHVGGQGKIKRNFRLPENWTPNAAEVAYALERNLDVDRTTSDFRDYWCAKGEARNGWTGSWQMWCRKQVDYRNQRLGKSGFSQPQKTAYQTDLEAKLRDMGLMDMPAEPEDLMTINGSFEEAFR
jgi:hypothetical protein